MFAEALALADSAAELPESWIRAAETVALAPNKTYTAALGTALLARATDGSVDPLTLAVEADPYPGLRSYSARNLAKEVLVPAMTDARIDLRATGPEPLNNSPFYGERVIHLGLKHRGLSARQSLEHLVEVLNDVRHLDEQEALTALAAFLRTRRAARAAALGDAASPRRDASLRHLLDATEAFVTADPEGGKRGQAVTAAALGLVHPGIASGRINDPSRHWPGDVGGYSSPVFDRRAVPEVSAEAKQRPVSAQEVLLFCERLAAAGGERALYAALHPEQRRLDEDAIAALAADEHGVVLEVAVGVRALLRSALTWSSVPVAEATAAFIGMMEARLIDIEVTDAAIAEWRAMFT